MEETIKSVYDGVLNGDQARVEAAVRMAIDAGVAPAKVLKDGLIEAMAEVGGRFERQEYFVPEMLVAARAMQAGLALLKPLLVEGDIKASGKIVLGTVKGDLHDIGKSLVQMMLEGAGFEVVDLGTDVPPAKFAEVARATNADIVGLSALLTTTMQSMAPATVASQTRIGGNPTAVALGLAKALLAQGKAREAEPVLDGIKDGPELAAAEKLRPLARYLIASGSVEDVAGADTPAAHFFRAARVLKEGSVIAALEEMLAVLRKDKRYRDGEARLVSLGLLELLDDADPQKREYLNKLASVLF